MRPWFGPGRPSKIGQGHSTDLILFVKTSFCFSDDDDTDDTDMMDNDDNGEDITLI